MYVRDAASLLIEQILDTMDDELDDTSHKGRNSPHVMNAETGAKECPAVERYTKCSK